MESTSKLADLRLVSKYYPVANYSYPRSRGHEASGSRGSVSRSSFGSVGSAPGLVDDRTDSETSAEDDYQYHAHASELWDTFWQSGSTSKQAEPTINPRRRYPALIPSPQQKKRQASQENLRAQAWPLPEQPLQNRGKRPAVTYSPFPKPMLLPARSTRPVPSWTSSRPGTAPQRPPRPDNDLLMPCVRESALSRGSGATRLPSFSMQTAASNYRPTTPQQYRPPPPPETPRPTTSAGDRPSMSLEPTASSMCCMSRSAASSPSPPYEARQVFRGSRTVSTPEPREPEPQSVFECDESDTELPSRSFFLFHRRANSDRSAKASELTVARRCRSRANTTPPRAGCHQSEFSVSKHETPTKKRQTDVWGRMLGRRGKA